MSDPNATPTRSDPLNWLDVARLARFLAAAFSMPPESMNAALDEPGVRAELSRTASSMGLNGQGIRAALDPQPVRDPDTTMFHRMLGHTVRSECPPYELEYRSAEVFQASQTLADISGFYRAFGFDVGGQLTERPDHVAAQWEFVAVLSVKAGIAARDADRACCVDALKGFLSDHAAAWMPAFFSRLCKCDPQGALARAATLGEALLRKLTDALEIEIGPQWLELRPVSDEDSTISCGAPGAVELGPTLATAMEARA